MPAFTRSADFAIDKPADTPCPNLASDHRCRIHDTLRERGFPGCTVYDCFGAGQQVVQMTFGGASRSPAMYAVFPVMRQLHEWLWYVSEALGLQSSAPLTSLRAGLARTIELEPSALLALDLDRLWARVQPQLIEVSSRVRLLHNGPDYFRADLAGADLRGRDLLGANLRGARLIGADLRDADLRWADLIGADMRGTRLAGADLRHALFVVQSQLDAAVGDVRTELPAGLRRPAHWPTHDPRDHDPPRPQSAVIMTRHRDLGPEPDHRESRR